MLLLAPLLMAVAGCADPQWGVGAAGIGLARADVSDLEGRLVQEEAGVEVHFRRDSDESCVRTSFRFIPMRNKETRETVNIYSADVISRVWVHSNQWDIQAFYVMAGAGWGVVFMDFEHGHDFGGTGPCLQLGTGLGGDSARFEVFADARAWGGGDAEREKAAGVLSLCAGLSVRF